MHSEAWRIVHAGAVTFATLSVALGASAQTIAADGFNPYPGTTRHATIEQGSRTHSQMFGAVSAFNRFVLPRINSDLDARRAADHVDDDDVHLSMGVEWNYIPAAYELLTSCNAPLEEACQRTGLSLSQVDMYASNISILGYFGNGLGLFYTASQSTTIVVGKGENRAITSYAAVMSPVMAYALSATRLLGPDGIGEEFGAMDGVIGGFAKAGPAVLYAGLVFSRGVFSNLSVPAIKAFAEAALGQDFSSLGYLAAGVRDLGFGDPNDIEDAIGETTAFVRRVKWVSPQPVVTDDPAGTALDLLTAHVGQTDIGRYVDLLGAVAITPKPSLFQGLLSAHTADFRKRANQGLAELEDELGVSATVGFVNLPNLYFYGLEGGVRPMFAAEIGLPASATVSLRYNDPELLTQLPIVQDSLSITARAQF